MAIERIANDDYSDVNIVKPLINNEAGCSLSEIARQFDAVFLQGMLKSVNIEQHFNGGQNSLAAQSHEVVPCFPDVQYTNKIIPPNNTLSTQNEQAMSLIPEDAVSAMNIIKERSFALEQSVKDFVKSILPYAKSASSIIGLDPKLLMAQAALETGWGKFIAKDADGNSSNNLFNIKAHRDHSGEAVSVKTREFIDDMPVNVVASFKKYQSIEQSFNDYISLIKDNHRYKAALENVHDAKGYIDALQRAGYATDPNYANKILSIYHSHELEQAMLTL